MRGAYRGSESTLRWALVGGIVVVVIIATVLAITSALGNNSNKKTANQGGNVPAATYCLWPKSVKVSATLFKPFKVRAAVPSLSSKRGLKHAEKTLKRHPNALSITRTGRHWLIINRRGNVIMGTAHGRAKGYSLKVSDAAFNGRATKIIYQKTSLAGHSCASLVLMKMGLSGKGRKLILASGAFRLANEISRQANAGTLRQDELPNGIIVLVHGQQLYGFNPAKQRIAPLETAHLGQLYSNSVTRVTTVPQFSVSPGARFVGEAKLGLPTFYVLPGWAAKPSAGPPNLALMAWSSDGKSIAYAPSGAATAIQIWHLVTGKRKTVALPAQYPQMYLTNLRWSADDRFIGFTGRRQSDLSSKPIAFIAKVTVAHPVAHALGVAPPAATPTGTPIPGATPTETPGATGTPIPGATPTATPAPNSGTTG